MLWMVLNINDKIARPCKYDNGIVCIIEKCKIDEPHMYFCKRWYEKNMD